MNFKEYFQKVRSSVPLSKAIQEYNSYNEGFASVRVEETHLFKVICIETLFLANTDKELVHEITFI